MHSHSKLAARLAVFGTPGDDSLTGGEGDDRVLGLAGRDTLIGGAGDDSLYGGEDTDFLYGGSGRNVMSGGAGADAFYSVEPFGPAAFDRVWGGDGNDLIDTGAGDDLVYGGAGDDQIIAWLGQGRSHGGTGDDLMLAVGGILWGDAGNDTLQGQDARGGAGDDSVLGDGGGSVIAGGSGRDVMTALSVQDDRLSGGGGADRFVFFETTRGVDVITDLGRGDTLDLTDFGVTAANLADTASEVAGDVRIVLAGGALVVVVQDAVLADLTLIG